MLDFTKLVGDEYVHHLLWLIDQPKDQVGASPTKNHLTMLLDQVYHLYLAQVEQKLGRNG